VRIGVPRRRSATGVPLVVPDSDVEDLAGVDGVGDCCLNHPKRVLIPLDGNADHRAVPIRLLRLVVVVASIRHTCSLGGQTWRPLGKYLASPVSRATARRGGDTASDVGRRHHRTARKRRLGVIWALAACSTIFVSVFERSKGRHAVDKRGDAGREAVPAQFALPVQLPRRPAVDAWLQ
jgi:hypothetical protein